MKVLFFNYEFPPLGGGAAVASSCILTEYAKRGDVMVDFVTSSIDEQYHKFQLGENVTIHRLPIGKTGSNIHYQTKKELITYTWKAYWFSRKLAKANKYDLTHSFFSVPCGFISMLLKFEFKLPYIVSLRGSDVPYYSERFKQLYVFITPIIRFIWNRADFVIANSKGLKDLALKSKPNKEIGVIYNGVDINIFSPKSELHHPDQIKIMCGTRVTPRKGMRLLIQAMDVLSKRYPQLRLVIVGEGDEKKSLEDLTRALNLQNFVEFLGSVPPEKRHEYYAQGDIYVSPSYNEGMANFMLECLSLGMPLVATDVGGTRELLTEGENGLIIKVGDYHDIVEKIEYLVKNPEIMKQMGEKSRQRAESMSWQIVANEYVDVYQKTINIHKIQEGE